MEFTGIDKYSVGKKISTKEIGSNARKDLTKYYKYDEFEGVLLILFRCIQNKQANKQTKIQTNQPNKQTNKQTNEQTNEQTNKQTNKQTTNKQINI